MKSTHRLLVAVVSGAFIVSAAGALAGPAVPGSKLKALFDGTTLYTSDVNGFFTPHNFEFQFKADGTVSAAYSIQPDNERQDPIEKNDSGTWQVSGEAVCVKFKQLFEAAQHCFTVRTATKAPKLYGNHMYRATMKRTGMQWLFALDK